MALFIKDQVISGPDGQGYRATRNLHIGDHMRLDDFEPIGGAPKIEAGALWPDWFLEQVQKAWR